ncbi:Hypothetical protein SCF082_LOCUS20545 [Durusdinium trenchii]|uniref:Uncharacterized protein n=1 Tax=Durusdinium trenchii TaxID=1381693 RepID=A0ABP0L3R4_9DINO
MPSKACCQTTRVIQSTDDLEGFEAIRSEETWEIWKSEAGEDGVTLDQDLLRRIIGGLEDVRQVQFGLGESTGQRKRGAEDDPAAVAAKRRREEEKLKEQIDIRKGNRCWAHCLVRFTDRDGSLRAKKSDKPELGMIVKEEEGGYVQIQFESKEHETERLEMMKKKRYGRIKGWLRYPRFFEGQIQKVDPKWIQKTRPPPRLCSCVQQEWNHRCDCGITCTRGTTVKVWGVGQ